MGPIEDNGVGFLSGTPLENIIGEYASDTDFYAYYICKNAAETEKERPSHGGEGAPCDGATDAPEFAPSVRASARFPPKCCLPVRMA